MHDAFKLSSGSPIIAGIAERVESLLLHGALPRALQKPAIVCSATLIPGIFTIPGGKIYVGCQNGSLHIYTLSQVDNDDRNSDARPTGGYNPRRARLHRYWKWG